MSVHYHGTPLTPQSMLFRMAGEHFCVPFSDPRDANVCQQIGQSIMFDNGAFAAMSSGKDPDFTAYYKWLEPRLGHPHWAVVPDKINGTVEHQRELVAQWPFRRELGAPVWHLGLPLSYLIELARAWPRICFGSSHQYWEIGSGAWCHRMDDAFEALATEGLSPWVHGMRMMAILGDPRWPLASGDSANVARNYKMANVTPDAMARRINASNSPAQWPGIIRTQTETGDFMK